MKENNKKTVNEDLTYNLKSEIEDKNISGKVENQNQNHNVKKQALGPNTKR